MPPPAARRLGLTWMPYRVFTTLKRANEDFVRVDLRPHGIDKTFILRLPAGDEGLSLQMKLFGFREPLNCRYYVKFVREEDKVLDIGSNVGFFVLLASHACRIACVEPLNPLIDILRENLEANNISEKCEIVNAAAGPRGKLRLAVNSQLNLSRIVTSGHEGILEVEGVPLPDLLEQYPSNLIRLDVEGFEYEILYDQIPDCVNKVSMEFHTRELGKERAARLLTYFGDTGFRIRHLIEDIPLRFYPILWAFKRTDLFNFMCYVKSDVTVEDAFLHIFRGRGIKYLYLERGKNATTG